jgi:hypothetical protein
MSAHSGMSARSSGVGRIQLSPEPGAASLAHVRGEVMEVADVKDFVAGPEGLALVAQPDALTGQTDLIRPYGSPDRNAGTASATTHAYNVVTA